jgi:6-phosphogluconolactonase
MTTALRMVVHDGEPGMAVGAMPVASARDSVPGVNFYGRHPWATGGHEENLTYPHCTLIDSDDDTLYVADMGMDRLYVHSIDRSGPHLSQREWLGIEGGPRMLAKHPSKPYLFVLAEPGSTLTMCRITPGAAVQIVSTKSTLEPAHENHFGASGIAVHPFLDFVFVSNRGDDSLATFSVSDDGLNLEGSVPVGVRPRHLSVDPSGRYVLCSNTYSNTITVFEIDEMQGVLQPINEIEVGTPNCTVYFTP